MSSISKLKSLNFRRPTRSRVVIFDTYSTRHIIPVLPDIQYAEFDTSLATINFWIALYSVRYGKPSLNTYAKAFIRLSGASLVITTIDNSPVVYQLKQDLRRVRVIVIQNGRRSTFGRLPNTSFVDELTKASRTSPNAVDNYFTFGTTEEAQFSSLIKCRYSPIGSIKNNYFSPNLQSRVRPLLSYISSFPNFDDNPDGTVFSDEPYLYFESKPISFRNYFEAELVVASWLEKFCELKSIDFQIVGKRSFRTWQEQSFFRSAVPGNWTFISCEGEFDSYASLTESTYVASVDSTLAYEMFGRGLRTMFFTIRSEFTNSPGLQCTRFGYPALAGQTGPMWTNDYKTSEFQRVADFVTSCSDDEWTKVVNAFSPEVMRFDPYNLTLARTISEYLNLPCRTTDEIAASVRRIYG